VTLYEELHNVLDALDGASIDYALVGGFPFSDRGVIVVSREALIAMKARAARPQDIADIESLKDIDR
jgi:molybdopterin-guanine dinucleotide biosynthesis protein